MLITSHLVENMLTGTNFTHEWLEGVMLRSPHFTNVVDVHLLSVTDVPATDSAGVGVSTIVNMYNLQWSVDDVGLPKSVVLKIPRLRPEGYLQKVRDTHNVECSFYETFGNVPRLKVPRCFYTRQMNILPSADDADAVIVLESVINSVHMPLADGFSVQQMKSFINATIPLHVACITDCLWPAQLTSRFSTVDEFMPTCLRICNQIDRRARERLDERCQLLLAQLEDELTPEAIAKCMLESHKVLGMVPVLSHGDIWSENIFFSATDTSEMTSLIDWQLCHVGVPVEGIAHMMARGMSAENRRQHKDYLIEYYHTQLSIALKDSTTPNPYTLDQLHRAYDAIQPWVLAGLLTATVVRLKYNIHEMSEGQVNEMMDNTEEYIRDVIKLKNLESK